MRKIVSRLLPHKFTSNKSMVIFVSKPKKIKLKPRFFTLKSTLT